MKKKRLLGIIIMIMTMFLLTFNASAAVKISKKSATLIKGQSVTLKITGTKEKVKWSSSKEKVAAVSQKGKVKAKAKGKATILAKVGGKTYKCKIKVETPKINKTKAKVNVGKTIQLKLAGNSQKVKWSSIDPNIATVSSKGIVTGKEAGTVTVTARVSNKKYTCKVTVKAPITDVLLDKSILLLDKGSKDVLQVSYLPLNTTSSTAVKWSSSNPDVVDVSNGVITGLSSGEAVITAKIGSKSDSCTVQVNETYGSVSGNVTYYYNKYKGNVADVGTAVFLFPMNGTAKDKYENITFYNASSDLSDYNIYNEKVDGSGSYTITHIPTGKYRMLLISSNVSKKGWFDAYDDSIEDAPDSFYEPIALYFSPYIGDESAMSLARSIAFRSWMYKDIVIDSNETLTVSHDFGITYI